MVDKNVVSMINSLTVFENIKKGEVLNCFRLIFYAETTEEKIARYSDFVSALYKRGGDFSKFLFEAACADENAYSVKLAKNEEISPFVLRCVKGELGVLQKLAAIKYGDMVSHIGYSGYLAEYESSRIDFVVEYERRMKNIARSGYGIFAENIMFRLGEEGGIEPVVSPDLRGIERLVGYEEERKALVENTRALLEGRYAANAFLYGDAGTGKSSTIKAVVNMFADEGLRLIEVKKNQLKFLPKITERIRNNPLKFIIFADDISFNTVDDNFAMLKTALEGSTSVKSDNTVIYATSNRRHFVKENFSDRNGDDVHVNDTLQETSALAARFGLTILFRSPNKKLYLEIVEKLVEARGLEIGKEELCLKAEAFALRKGGFSPRAAEQFADMLLSEKKRGE